MILIFAQAILLFMPFWQWCCTCFYRSLYLCFWSHAISVFVIFNYWFNVVFSESDVCCLLAIRYIPDQTRIERLISGDPITICWSIFVLRSKRFYCSSTIWWRWLLLSLLLTFIIKDTIRCDNDMSSCSRACCLRTSLFVWWIAIWKINDRCLIQKIQLLDFNRKYSWSSPSIPSNHKIDLLLFSLY